MTKSSGSSAEEIVRILRKRVTGKFDEKKSEARVGAAKVRSVSDPKQLWIQQLCALPRVSLKKAEAIALQYPSANHLIDAFCDTNDKNILADIRVSDGRRIGPSLSALIYSFYTTEKGEDIVHNSTQN